MAGRKKIKPPKPDEATRTLVGARPIKMLEEERRQRAAAGEVSGSSAPTPIPLRVGEDGAAPEFRPDSPKSIEETGLPQVFLEELCLKHLFQAGELRGGEISLRTCVPPVVLEELMERLRQGQLVDIKGTRGVGIGRTQTVFALTEAGNTHAELALERDKYVGPAPVPFATYCDAVAAQTIRGNQLAKADLEPFFSDLVFEEGVSDGIGPAMNGARSLFLYGPPGNGKTSLGRRITRCFGGEVFVPHAILVDHMVIKVFDEALHEPVDETDADSVAADERWVLCHRPMVVVGGDLSPEDLELRYSPSLRYYEAPFQLKANGGVLMIDDLGRQKVSPEALLNRWIVPLDSEHDFLATQSGKKLRVPFDVFIIFSTNFDPAELVDEAFLRRVRYKVEVKRPTAKLYRTIFENECERRGLRTADNVLDHLVKQHYKAAKRPFNACEPRDLLDQVVDVCTYRGIEPMLSTEIIDHVASNYFVRFVRSKKAPRSR